MENYFIWKGIDSREMGVWVQKYPAIVRPPMRYQQVTIPGRPGALTLIEGADAYDVYTREIRIMPKPGADYDAIMNWLTGRSTVIFGCESSKQQRASVYDKVQFEWQFAEQRSAQIIFLCDPFKTSIHDKTEYVMDVSQGSYELTNHGDVLAYPLFVVTASSTFTLTVNGVLPTLTGLDGHTATIDCEARTTYMEVEDEPEPEEETEEETEETEEETEEQTEEQTEEETVETEPVPTHLEPVLTHGDYAVLSNNGTTTIEWTEAVTSLKVYPRWRWF